MRGFSSNLDEQIESIPLTLQLGLVQIVSFVDVVHDIVPSDLGTEALARVPFTLKCSRLVEELGVKGFLA